MSASYDVSSIWLSREQKRERRRKLLLLSLLYVAAVTLPFVWVLLEALPK